MYRVICSVLPCFRHDQTSHEIEGIAIRLQIYKAIIAPAFRNSTKETMVGCDAHNPYLLMGRCGGESDQLISAWVSEDSYCKGHIDAYECNQRSRYRSMKGSNEPFPITNVFHMPSNLVIRVANVRSMLRLCSMPGGRSFARDAMGGGLSTFSPQPTAYLSKIHCMAYRKRARTNYNIDVVSRESGINQDTCNFCCLGLFVPDNIDVVWPLDAHSISPLAKDFVISARFDDRKREEVLNKN